MPLLDLAGMTPATRRLVRLGALAAVVAALSAILLLGISGWFLAGAALAGAGGAAAVAGFNYLVPSAAIRLLAILRTAGRYGERIWSHEGALSGMAELRADLFARLAAQDSRSAPDLAAGDASARLIGDIEALEDLVVRRPARAAALGAGALGLALAALAGWAAALALALLLALLPFVLRRAAERWTRAPARDAAEALGALRDRYVELAAARPEIAAYGLGERVAEELAPFAARLDAARGRLFRAEAAMGGLLALYGAVAVVAVLLAASAPVPILALALLAAAAAVEAMGGLARSAFRNAAVEEGLARIAALRELPLAEDHLPAAARPAQPLRLAGRVLEPGARLAITGISGSGKTMLLEALAGMRAGAMPVEVGGVPLPQCPGEVLRGQFALSPQDAPMLAGTVEDNLRLARPGITEAEMWQALEIAQLRRRIETAPTGLATRLGEAGGILSGGERKRLSLARALLARRPWLLLDEPTEGLDPATEAVLVAALDDWLAQTGTGLILVSHRRAPLALAEASMDVAELVRC
ncbi:ABC transporter ATP-binding protein [Altererythrobacter sp. B11]|uniref:ATP-binding cassette domain-containing protein n=1 Tax=Altererythrobacter sp. B11 TaxID=2060312 RepID=UPI000DC72857|nr:ATP-binding cassette domain-containing protein [Altererythrobacter sp. B11]BBC70990.1 ABC transporter ATP-binding protein [Altererythrobacter sp. B11]